MAKILLYNPIIREFAKPNNPPLGVMYLASVLEKAGHEVRVLDMNGLRAERPERQFWAYHYADRYDFIGISGLITTYKEQRWFLDYLQTHGGYYSGNPMIIIGGGLATSIPEFVADRMPEVDVIALGEGENTILDIVEGKDMADIPGIAYKRNGELIFNLKRELIADLDSIPFPAWNLVPMEKVYLRNAIWGKGTGNSSGIDYEMKRSTNIINSRGCPFRCRFCYHYIWEQKYRIRSPENVVAEMAELKRLYNVDFVGFVDDNTTASHTWVRKFCNLLIQAKLGILWGCSARADKAEQELYYLMRKAGCMWLGFGGESANANILELMDKRITADQTANAVKMARKAGIFANVSFIAGYEGETKESLRETAQFMKAHGVGSNMFFATAYPETEFFNRNKAKILEKYPNIYDYYESLGDATEFRINFSELSDEDLFKYREMAINREEF